MNDAIKVGQTWRRKSDGVETVIIHPGSAVMYNSWVVHKAKRLTHTERRGFLKKYELVKEVAPDGR